MERDRSVELTHTMTLYSVLSHQIEMGQSVSSPSILSLPEATNSVSTNATFPGQSHSEQKEEEVNVPTLADLFDYHTPSMPDSTHERTTFIGSEGRGEVCTVVLHERIREEKKSDPHEQLEPKQSSQNHPLQSTMHAASCHPSSMLPAPTAAVSPPVSDCPAYITPPPFPLLPSPPSSLMQKLCAILARGQLFTKYSYSEGAPQQVFVFFHAPRGPSESSCTSSSTTAERSFGCLYWNADPELIGDEIQEEAREEAASVRGRAVSAGGGASEGEEQKLDGAVGWTPSPSATTTSLRPSSHSRTTYFRSPLRCIPLVSVIEVRTGSEPDQACRERAQQEVEPMDPWALERQHGHQARKHRSRRRASVRGGSVTGATAAAAALRVSSPDADPQSFQHPAPIQCPGFPSHALSQSFARWTLNPWINVDSFRAARKKRRLGRKQRRKALKERMARRVALGKSPLDGDEDPISSDTDDDSLDDQSDDEDDAASYSLRFKPPPLEQCLSIITPERTMDLVAPSVEVRDVWSYALRVLSERAGVYFNDKPSLPPSAVGAALSVRASDALVESQARRAWILAHRPQGIMARLNAFFRPEVARAQMAAAVAMMPSQTRSAREQAEATLLRGKPHVQATPLNVHSGLGSAESVSLVPIPSASTVFIQAPSLDSIVCVELRLACRHLVSRSDVPAPPTAPCILVYALPHTQPLRGFHESEWVELQGVGLPTGTKVKLIGRTELGAHDVTVNGDRAGGSNPSFNLSVVLPSVSHFESFHFVVHDFGTTFHALPEVEPPIADLRRSPILGWVRLSYDELTFGVGRELARPLLCRGVAPQTKLEPHWLPQSGKGTHALSLEDMWDVTDEPSSPLPMKDGLPDVTDAMLDAYKAHALERAAREEAREMQVVVESTLGDAPDHRPPVLTRKASQVFLPFHARPAQPPLLLVRIKALSAEELNAATHSAQQTQRVEDLDKVIAAPLVANAPPRSRRVLSRRRGHSAHERSHAATLAPLFNGISAPNSPSSQPSRPLDAPSPGLVRRRHSWSEIADRAEPERSVQPHALIGTCSDVVSLRSVDSMRLGTAAEPSSTDGDATPSSRTVSSTHTSMVPSSSPAHAGTIPIALTDAPRVIIADLPLDLSVADLLDDTDTLVDDVGTWMPETSADT
jgi:hypothetical protein